MDLDIIVTAPTSHDERDEARTGKQKYIALPPQDDELEEYTGRDGAEYTPEPWSSTTCSSIDEGEGEGDLEDLTPLSQTVSQPRRVSIDQFYLHQHLPDRTTRPPPPTRDAPSPTNTIASTTTASTSSAGSQTDRLTADDLVQQSSLSPPPYSSSILNRSAINITPRIEEGRETLPPYSCDLTLSALFMRKCELEGPHLNEPSDLSNPLRRAPMRTWHRVQVTLRGTSLTITPCPRLSLKSKPLAPPRSYSLQHAEAGIASDYLKRRYVIRLRVEADQLLLASSDAPTHIAWLEALAAAIDLAPSLDERSLPEEASLPRPRRRRAQGRYVAPGSASARRTAAARAAAASAEAAVAPPVPRHADVPEEPSPAPVTENIPAPERAPPPPPILDSEPNLAPTSSLSVLESAISPRSSNTSTDTPTVRPSHRPHPDPYNIYPPTLAARGARNPAITRDGKWRPVHNWSPLYDLIYAKRCMATLLNGSPRKGPFVIMQGERWVVDWETGRCARWVPKGEGEEGGDPGLPGYEK